jgi:hypothetical protein
MSMVITSYIPAEKFSKAVEHPCQFWIGTIPFRLSIFGRRQHHLGKQFLLAGLLGTQVQIKAALLHGREIAIAC